MWVKKEEEELRELKARTHSLESQFFPPLSNWLHNRLYNSRILSYLLVLMSVEHVFA